MNLFRRSSLDQENAPGGIVRYHIDHLHKNSINTLVSSVTRYRKDRDPKEAQSILIVAENTISKFRDDIHRKEFLRKLRKPGGNKKTPWSLWGPKKHHSDTVFEIKRAYFESLALLELENQEE